MAAFTYSAIDASGLELSGELHAPDLAGAREQLRIRGLLASSLDELPASGEEGAKNVFKKVKPKTLQIFSRQFATMIEAGLNIVAALVILEQQTDDLYFATVVKELRADVEGGLLLSQAMRRHPKIFDRLFVSMVQAGEAAGILDEVLDRVAYQIEKSTQIKRRVKGAMLYPTMVLVFATLVLTGLLMFLVPVFVKIFGQLGGQLPTLTQYVVSVSDLLRQKYYIIFPVVGALIFGLRKYKKTDAGRKKWDQIKLKIPMKIGSVVLKVTMARFSRTLSTLYRRGCRHHPGSRDHRAELGELGDRASARRRSREGRRGRPDRAAAGRQPDLPADGQPDGEDRRGDRRAREDARQGRGLLRGRSRRGDPVADVDRRAVDDDPGGTDGRRHRDRDVLAECSDVLARQVTIKVRLRFAKP